MARPFAALAVLACLALVPSLSARARAENGAALYGRSCARCHGASGHGDGPDAAIFAAKPPDLCNAAAHQTVDEIVARVLDGAPREVALDPARMRARAAEVESLIAYMRRLPTIDWRRADPGSAVYADRCQPCHGAYGQPTGALPPGVQPPRDLSDPAFQTSVTDADLIRDVRHGRAGMPALVPRVTDAEAKEVAAFVRILSPGFTTYSQYCADCHGAHGIPAGSFAEGQPAPTAIFDRAYFARRDAEALHAKVWHMVEAHRPTMPHFRGALTPARARAIAHFLQVCSGR
jgi:mono/diheme cytochrome c family protein